MLHSAIAHHHLTDAQPVPEQQPPTSVAPSLYTEYDTCRVEYPFGHLGWAVPALSPPSSLCPPDTSQVGRCEKLKSLCDLV